MYVCKSFVNVKVHIYTHTQIHVYICIHLYLYILLSKIKQLIYMFSLPSWLIIAFELFPIFNILYCNSIPFGIPFIRPIFVHNLHDFHIYVAIVSSLSPEILYNFSSWFSKIRLSLDHRCGTFFPFLFSPLPLPSSTAFFPISM